MGKLRGVRRGAVLAAGVLLVIAGTAGCAKENTGTTVRVKLVQAGWLITCTHLPYAPFQSEDRTGKVIGFDVDLIDLVAAKLGVTQKIVDTPFDGIKSGADLNVGKCDVAAAAMTITDERRKVLDFSEPYFDATQALAVPASEPYRTLPDLVGRRIGVQGGTTGEAYVRDQMRKQHLDINVIPFHDLGSLQQALEIGQVDAAVGDVTVWNDYTRIYKSVIVANGFNTGEQYGFGVKRGGDPKLLETINDVLEKAHADGTYDSIYKKWIGDKPAK